MQWKCNHASQYNHNIMAHRSIASSLYHVNHNKNNQTSQLDAELQAKLTKNEITPAGAEELRKQLKNQQELERSNLTAHLEVEEKEEIHKLDKVLDEEYQDNARNFYKEALVKKLREKGTLSADKEKELMKKLTSDV